MRSFISLLSLVCLAQGLVLRAETIDKQVSIDDMIGSNPVVVNDSTQYNQEYTVPVDPDEASKAFASTPYGCQGPDMCKCQPKRFKSVRWVTSSTSQIRGATHRISEALCPPGTISKSYTYSYSYSVNVQAGPDIKGAVIPMLDKFGIRAGFSYTWGRAESNTYTVQCNSPNNNHPCVETFSPNIGIIKGYGYETVEVPGGKICSQGPKSYMEIHVPITDSSSCSGKSSTCGAAGVYDSCYYIGDLAANLCPRRNLGPTPKDHICPANLK